MSAQRRKHPAPANAPIETVSDGVTAMRCISCDRRVLHFPPMDRQLPNTSPRYPLCAECLTVMWRRYGDEYGAIPAWVD